MNVDNNKENKEDTKDENKPLIGNDSPTRKGKPLVVPKIGNWDINTGYENEPIKVVGEKTFFEKNPLYTISMIFAFLIMLYYWLFYSHCGSSLDEDMNTIMIIYLTLIGFILIDRCIETLGLQDKDLYGCVMSMVECALIIYMIYLVQSGYTNGLQEWPNCGCFRGMTLVWLVLIYSIIIGMTILNCGAACSSLG